MAPSLSPWAGVVPNLAHSSVKPRSVSSEVGNVSSLIADTQATTETDISFSAILVVAIHLLGALVLTRSRTKLGGREAPISPNERTMVEMMGYSSLGNGLTPLLALLWNNNSRLAIVAGFLPRAIHLILDTTRPSDSDVNLTIVLPVYGILTCCLISMFFTPTLELDNMAHVMAVIYLCLGSTFCMVPAVCAHLLNYSKLTQAVDAGAAKAASDNNDDSNQSNVCYMHALIRSQGKKDMIYGGLLLGISLEQGASSIGLSCRVWSLSILLADGLFQNYRAMGSSFISPLIQLAVALVGFKNLSA